jgi:RNA polymerase-binding transcription factor DksA
MDEIDEADIEYATVLNAKIKDIESQLNRMPVGTPGECIKCGEHMPRLVDGICCPCRDKYKLR